MDTDNLSREVYQGVLMEAEKLTHDLTLQYGLLAAECKNEADYIEQAILLTREILEADEEELEDIFWENVPDRKKLIFTLEKILDTIEQIKQIPIENRHYDF